MNFNLKKSVREASELACSDKNFAVKLLLLYFTKEKILKLLRQSKNSEIFD